MATHTHITMNALIWCRYGQQLTYKKLECGPMPTVMVTLLNIVGALC